MSYSNKNNNSFKYKVGAVAGKFRAVTKAHKEYIIQAGTMCEKLYIFIVDVNNALVDINDRRKAIGKICLNSKINYVINIVKDDIGLSENWDQYMLDIATKNNDLLEVVFNSKENYKNYLIKNEMLKLSSLYEGYSVSNLNKNYKQFYDTLANEFRPFMNMKVVVTGIESTGKSTLTKRLAEIFSSGYSKEFGKDYHNLFLGGIHEAYVPSDFVKIAMHQVSQDAIINMNSSRHIFVDTDALVTKYYLELYSKDTSDMVNEEDLESARITLDNMIQNSKYDLLIMLAPTVPFVADEGRFYSDYEQRKKLHNQLCQMYDDYGISYFVIDEADYGKRLEIAKNLVTRVEQERMAHIQKQEY